MGMVDTIFADVAQPDQARIVALNAQYFLKNGGHFVISIKVRFYFFFFFVRAHISFISCITRIIIFFIIISGKLHRFDCPTGSSFCIGSEETYSRQVKTAGTNHARALREGPCCGSRCF